ncbi:hypothetical protein Hanom_Chr06g00526271 [Helianthus anomalus]
MSTSNQPEYVIEVEEVARGMPPIKWDELAFEQIVYGLHFPDIWGGTYPSAGQTTTNAPVGFITLFSYFFQDDSFCCRPPIFLESC